MQLPIYEVSARNTSADSENKIHDDAVAARFGFSGGLVPGVTIFAYLTVPIVARFPEWLDRGAMRVRFIQPFYEGDPVVVRAQASSGGDGVSIDVRAERRDGTICATATANVRTGPEYNSQSWVSQYRTRPLPSPEARLAATGCQKINLQVRTSNAAGSSSTRSSVM